MADDPYRMFPVVRRGALTDLPTGGALAGAAAVACLRRFEDHPAHAEAIAAWRDRPGKVTLRARGGQWDQLLQTEPHALAGDPDGAAVVALPPRRRSQRGDLLTKMQAMSSELDPAPRLTEPPRPLPDGLVTYLLNPRLTMSSGKTLAQIAHAATAAAHRSELSGWVAAGCPAVVVSPRQQDFDALCAHDADPALAAKVEDAGLTEVEPGTVTVLALAPAGTRLP